MAQEPEFLRHDPVSAQAVARVLLVSGFIGAWCTLIHILTARPVTPVPILMIACFVTLSHAVSKRERPLASNLNRWDEAAAHLGLAALAHAVIQAAAS